MATMYKCPNCGNEQDKAGKCTQCGQDISETDRKGAGQGGQQGGRQGGQQGKQGGQQGKQDDQ